MENLKRVGRILFAVAIAGFGTQLFLHASGAGPKPGPPWSTGRPLWAYATALLLIVAAACIVTGKQLRCAGIAVAILTFLRALLLYGPKLAANIHNPGPWTSGFELLAMCGAALILAGTMTGLGRVLFASLLVVVGVQHILYGRFVATLVTAWIPAHLFWAYFVGVAFLAAAISIVTRKYMKLAAGLLGLMFLLWVVLLHAPRVAAAVHNGDEWTSALVALSMCGGSWMIAGRAKS